MSGCLISDGKLLQSRGAAAANVLSPKELELLACTAAAPGPEQTDGRTACAALGHLPWTDKQTHGRKEGQY